MSRNRCRSSCCGRDTPDRLKDEGAGAYLVADELWERFEPLIPKHENTHPLGGGRPRACDRCCLDGILYVLRTGCQWKALSATGICKSSTAHDRLTEWVAAGVFLELWKAGLAEYDELVGLDWRWLSMDGAMTKAPLGGKKTGNSPVDRSKKGTKRSLLTEAAGVPVAVAVGGANKRDMKMVRETLGNIAADRPAPGPRKPRGVGVGRG